MNLGYFLYETKIPCLKGMDTKKRLSGKLPKSACSQKFAFAQWSVFTFPVKWGVTYLL